MRAFSVSSEYIFNSTASLNLILAIVMLSFAPTSAPIPNVAPLPSTNTSTANKDYNTGLAVVSFLVIVKPIFITYLEKNLKRLYKARYLGKI